MNSHWTNEVDEEAKVYFATLSEREIRRRQDLCSQQLRIAHANRNTRALIDLQRMEHALAREMLTRC